MPKCSCCDRELTWLHDYTYVCYYCTKLSPRQVEPLNVSSKVKKPDKCPECGSKLETHSCTCTDGIGSWKCMKEVGAPCAKGEVFCPECEWEGGEVKLTVTQVNLGKSRYKVTGSKTLPIEIAGDMPFPAVDLPALLSGEKTVTCRVYNEQGKYKKGIYRVTNYSGIYQNAHVNVQRVVTTKVKKLPDLGISRYHEHDGIRSVIAGAHEKVDVLYLVCIKEKE